MTLSWTRLRCFFISLAILSGLILLVYCITLNKSYNAGADTFTWNETGNNKGGNYSTAAEVTSQGRLEQNGKTSKVEPITENIQDSSTTRKRLPNAIIIGSAKAGTRALLVSLKMRPDVKACPVEVHFFDRDENYRLGLEWYRQKMLPSKVSEITIEKSPAYFTAKDVPKRVHNMSSSVKLLVVVRDPTVRAISEYTQFVSRVQTPALPKFEKYVTVGSDQKVLNKKRGVIMSGVYIKHLRRWLKYFPLSQIHFVSGEELVKNPAAEVNRVEKFLDLKPVITEANFYFNKTKGFRCFIGKIGSKGKRKSSCLNTTKGRKHVPVREDVKKLMQDYYRPFNRQLYEVVGRTFNWA